MVIFCIVTIATWGILLATIDANFLAVQSLNANYQDDKQAANMFEMANLTAQTYQQFYLLYGAGNSHTETFNLPPGHEIEFWWYEDEIGQYTLDIIEVRHTWPGFLGIGRSFERLWIIYPYSDDVFIVQGLRRSDLTALWGNRVANASYCEWQRSGYSTKTFISPWNASRTIAQSWDDQNVTFTVGFIYDWNQSNINAFDLLGQILFFQAPTLGLTGVANTIMNAFIAIPLWVMIAIVALKLIQSVIPLIKGTED